MSELANRSDGIAFETDGPATFHVSQERDVAVVRATGEIDIYTAPVLREALVAAGAQGRRIVIDLSEVTFLDSTGLGVMLGARGRANHVDGAVSLAGATDMVMRVLRITRLDQVFPTYPRLEDALAV